MKVLWHTLCCLLLLVLASLSTAQAQQKPIIWTSGPYAGVGFGYSFGTAHSGPSGDILVSSGVGSVFLGYDKQFASNLVLGVVGGVAPFSGLYGSTDRPCAVSLCGLPARNHFHTQVDWAADIRVRAGYPLSETVMPYLTVGYLFGAATSKVDTSFRGVALAHQKVGSGLSGPIYGAGVEYRLLPNVTLGAEYLRINAGVNHIPDASLDTNVFRVNVAYHF